MDLNTITCLWLKGDIGEMEKMTIDSWLKLGYNVDLYSYQPWDISCQNKPRLNVIDARKVMNQPSPECEGEGPLPPSDLWRFTFLYKFGGTWIDLDLPLLKRLPDKDIIISSEHTIKNGAYKSNADYLANIGVLRFSADHPLLAKRSITIKNSSIIKKT
jgi:hypothetical protein